VPISRTVGVHVGSTWSDWCPWTWWSYPLVGIDTGMEPTDTGME